MPSSLLNEPVKVSARAATDAHVDAAVLSAHGLVKTYTLGEVVVHALREVDLDCAKRSCSRFWDRRARLLHIRLAEPTEVLGFKNATR